MPLLLSSYTRPVILGRAKQHLFIRIVQGFKPLALSISLAFIASAHSPTIYAQDNVEQAPDKAVRTYSIKAGSLDTVLAQFGQQSGVMVSVNGAVSKGKRSPGLEGDYSVEQALNALLVGTGLTVLRQANGSYIVTDIKQDSDATLLKTVNVEGAEIGESVGVSVEFSGEELNDIQPRDLKDIFSGESSVSVGGSIPMNQKLYLRGIEETALSVKIDGARQNNKIFHHSATTLIDPVLLKSVRASAGVSPADDGQGAIGGSVIFETVDVGDLLMPDETFGGFLNGSYDSNSKTKTTAASLYTRQDGFEVLGVINKASGDDYKDGNGRTVQHTAAALLSGLFKVAYETEQGDRFELSHELVEDDAVRPYRANFSGLTAGRPVPESRVYDLARTNTVFNYHQQQKQGLWNPNLVIAQSESDLETTEVPLAAPSTTVVYNGIIKSTSLTASNEFITRTAKINVGLDYYKDNTKFRFEGDPDLVEEVENTGAFVQIRQEFDVGVRLSYGLRYDQQDFTGTDNSQQDLSGSSKNFSIEYDVHPNVTLNAGYADIWGGIAVAENFILNGAWDYSGGISAAKADNFVLGLKSQVNDFYFGANAYETDIKDGRTPSYGGGPSLTSDFEINGYDVFFGYRKGHDEVSIKYSNIKGKKDGEQVNSYDGNYFTSPLGELISVSGIKMIANYDLKIGANLEVSLDNEDVAVNGAKQEGYSVLDVFIEHVVNEDFDIRMTIDNVTDEAYVDRASYGQEFVTVQPLYEIGRTFIASARYRF